MRILLVYPEYPETFWNFKFALQFIAKKASYPPLGLLTVAAMLPAEWEQKLIDMNTTALKDEEIRWADLVLISAASIQRKSTLDVIRRCKEMDVRTVAGGPMFTECPEDFDDVDFLVLNEAEVTLPQFLLDLNLDQVKHIYTTTQRADLTTTPIPRWDLINARNYAALNIQLSRGCPYDCEFCNITALYGRTPRSKNKEQIIAELDCLYDSGWRGGVFFVDDNFIGDKAKVKRDILPEIIDWMHRHKYPFVFNSQVPVNLADDEELMKLMSEAGFGAVFVGIETPNEESLAECSKTPNKNRDLMSSVNKIQRAGFEVQAGFIVGFDNDPASIFDRVINFIQESGIVTAMVGLLNAPNGTRLYKRLMEEHRLTHDMSGNNTDSTMNFIPKMNPEVLTQGYRRIVERIYSPNLYYNRVKLFLREYRPVRHKACRRPNIAVLPALYKATVVLGMIEKERKYYWRLMLWSIFHRPRLLPLAITLTAYGFHFRKSFEQHSTMET